jgi:hypothetical protein
MIGGWYVLALEHDGTYERAGLLAGPFAFRSLAEGAVPKVQDRVNRYPKTGRKVRLSVCEFYAPEAYSGLLNGELWLTHCQWVTRGT